jgi:hypothetical protein
MAWTTEITSKIIVDGLLKVEVAFSDGKQVFKDRYETRSLQDANWLDENIKRRIADLEGVVTLADTIATGAYIAKEPLPVDDTKITAKELYAKELAKFEKLVGVIKKGIIADDNVDFLASKQWLINNWSIDYIDLF